MLELSMASARSHLDPTSGLQHVYDVPHFHCGTLAAGAGDRYLLIRPNQIDSGLTL